MGDSTTMTVEFLRARLLSERSVSRTARLRADELAKTVTELEYQLKMVSLQKIKAEKAMTDVLAILKDHGPSDVSEALESDSDQDVVPCESKVSNPSKKEEDRSVNPELKINDAEEFSGSEIESSPLSSRSLSWKSCKDSMHSNWKNLNSSIRRRSGFASPDSPSPKQQLGRSCRQIKCREMRSAVEDPKVECFIPNPEDTGASKHSEDFINYSNNRPQTLEEGSENQGKREFLEGLVSGSSKEERKQFATDVDHGHGREKDMERALEHQAQLIDRFEAEEKAQREWEEKFRENSSSTLDSCEPGNHSDVTEERDECKAQAAYIRGTVASVDQESKLKVEGVHLTSESSKAHSNCFQPRLSADVGCSPSEFAFPMAKTQIEEHVKNKSSPSPSNSSQPCCSPSGFPDNQFTNAVSYSPADCSKSSKAEASGSQKELALMSNETPDGIGGILEALQRARLSLYQKLNGQSPLEDGSTGKAIGPSFPDMRPPDKAEIPVGVSQFFRVPSDFRFEANKVKFMGSSASQIPLSNHYPVKRDALTAVDQFSFSPYTETHLSPTNGQLMSSQQINEWSRIQKPSFDPYSDRVGDRFVSSAYMGSKLGVSGSRQFITGPYGENSSGPSSQKSSFGPYLDAGLGLPSSGRYTHPVYPEPKLQMPSNKGFSRPLSRSPNEQMPAERFSLNDDNIRQYHSPLAPGRLSI